MYFVIVWWFFLIVDVTAVRLQNCPQSDVKFEKVLGLRPHNTSQAKLLHKLPNNSTLRPVTKECIVKCQSNESCSSFVLFYQKSQCYYFQNDVNALREADYDIDENVVWFIKVCYKLKKACDKLWIFERTPGAALIGNDNRVLPGHYSRTECQQYCLNTSEFSCRSAHYKIVDLSAYSVGRCALSSTDRHLLPSSFRVSGYDDEYFENQCTRSDVEMHGSDFCSYEQYDNTTLTHSDVLFEKKSKEECQSMCDSFTNFNCRGYNIVGDRCYINSEDSKIFGPSLLRAQLGATYYEKATCLNITVSCSETYMTIRYMPELNFQGKMYMKSYSEDPQCYVLGQGKNRQMILRLPLLANTCGIVRAAGSFNRTLLSGTLIIQYNPIIQTQSDRIIRVGCIFGNGTKVVIGTGVKVSPSTPNKGSALINPTSNTTNFPIVDMRILDLKTHEEVSDTQIGQELQLIIELKMNGSFDIWASHLVAMTEKNDESIFLLDDRGCPTNLNIFPALDKIYTGSSTQLLANFQAFKFAASPVVRFSVIVQFCPKECPAVECGDNIISYGRKKRELRSYSIQTINGTTVVKINRTEFDERSNIVSEIPLEYFMLVRDSQSISDKLVFGDNSKILFAGYDYSTREVCMDYSLVIGLIITWILVQLIFLIGCIILVRRYKRYYQHECTRQSLEELHKNFGIGFSNLENRRVHWADSDNIL